MGIYTYHLARIVRDPQHGAVGLLAFTGNAPFPFRSADIARNVAKARRLSRATCAREHDGLAPIVVAFLTDWERAPAACDLFRWRRRRLAYLDGKLPGAILRREA